MHKVVSNTTPIISLLKIGKLDLLKELYGRIIIPHAVFLELEKGKNKAYYMNLTSVEWIEIRKIESLELKAYIPNLDFGEAEAIMLAKELNADLVIMDEIIGRKYAKNFNLNITGTLGILLKAKEKGLISSVGNLLDELTEKDTWLHPKLVAKVRKLAGEE